MAIATNALKQTLANAYAGACTYASLHTADPGTTGTSEVSGGTYARVALTWNTSSGTGTATASATFNVPASTTVTYAGLTTASTGGTFQDKIAITSQTFASAGTLTVNFTFTES